MFLDRLPKLINFHYLDPLGHTVHNVQQKLKTERRKSEMFGCDHFTFDFLQGNGPCIYNKLATRHIIRSNKLINSDTYFDFEDGKILC